MDAFLTKAGLGRGGAQPLGTALKQRKNEGDHKAEHKSGKPKEKPENREQKPEHEKEKKDFPVPLEISHTTDVADPRNGKKDRKRIGVGEMVWFEGSRQGNWEASSGMIFAGSRRSNRMYWRAPETGGSVTITLTSGKETKQIHLDVIPPQDILAAKEEEISYRPDSISAGMLLRFKLFPDDVSFYNVQTKEVSGPASGIEGYYHRYDPTVLEHDSGDTFFSYRQDNYDTVRDVASLEDENPPPGEGQYRWVIPNHYRIAGSSGNGHHFTNVQQIFKLNRTGRLTILKAGQRVSRRCRRFW